MEVGTQPSPELPRPDQKRKKAGCKGRKKGLPPVDKEKLVLGLEQEIVEQFKKVFILESRYERIQFEETLKKGRRVLNFQVLFAALKQVLGVAYQRLKEEVSDKSLQIMENQRRRQLPQVSQLQLSNLTKIYARLMGVRDSQQQYRSMLRQFGQAMQAEVDQQKYDWPVRWFLGRLSRDQTIQTVLRDIEQVLHSGGKKLKQYLIIFEQINQEIKMARLQPNPEEDEAEQSTECTEPEHQPEPEQEQEQPPRRKRGKRRRGNAVYFDQKPDEPEVEFQLEEEWLRSLQTDLPRLCSLLQ